MARITGIATAKAPFKLRAVLFDVGTGHCDHCGAFIAVHCEVEDANGQRFFVGSGCVKKTGDRGLYRAFTQSKEVRAHNKKVRDAKALVVRGELRLVIEAQADVLCSRPHPYGMTGLTALDYADFILMNAGDSGRAKLLRQLKAALTKPDN